MKKTFIILFLILVACSNSPENAIEKCTDEIIDKDVTSWFNFVCDSMPTGITCDVAKKSLNEWQKIKTETLAVKLNDEDYVESWKECEIEYESTPKLFMNKWSN